MPLVDAGARADVVGAKAARLGALLRAGERVPDGFGVIGQTDAALAWATAANHRLGPDIPVAVRSSSLAEDSGDANFAGQFLTVLDIVGEDAFKAALQRCWASAESARVSANRERRSLSGHSAVQMAVLVLRMVHPRVAGVAFSANPLAGDRGQVLIETALGLGETVVSGTAATDVVTVSEDGTVGARPAGERPAMLTDDEGRQIAALARRIALSAGAPQDIEWALGERGLWLLQARPITALPDVVPWDSPAPNALWVKDLRVGEWVKEPPSPLGVTTTLETRSAAREQTHWRWPVVWPAPVLPGNALINGWVYTRRDQRPASELAAEITFTLAILTGAANGHLRVRHAWTAHLAKLNSLEVRRLASLSDASLAAHADGLLFELGWWWIEVVFFSAMLRVSEVLLRMAQPAGLADASAVVRGNDSLLLDAERALKRAASGAA